MKKEYVTKSLAWFITLVMLVTSICVPTVAIAEETADASVVSEGRRLEIQLFRTEYSLGEDVEMEVFLVDDMTGDRTMLAPHEYTMDEYDRHTPGMKLITVRYDTYIEELTVHYMENLDAEGSMTAAGMCGDNLHWELYSNGKLRIYGDGEMRDITWEPYKESITYVIIDRGAINIAANAFGGCQNLRSISIPDSVEVICNHAFADCRNLTEVMLPGSVRFIEDHAFRDCVSLREVVALEGVARIENSAFIHCDNLERVTLPESLEYLGDRAFAYCMNLREVYYAGSEARWRTVLAGDMVFEYPENVMIYYGMSSVVELEYLEVISNKETYFIDEPWDLSVYARYMRDGMITETEVYDYEVHGFDTSSPGERTAFVTYLGQEFHFTYYVEEAKEEIDEGLTGITAYDTTCYRNGRPYPEVYAEYFNGERRRLSAYGDDAYKLMHFDPSMMGMQTVQIRYKQFEIPVMVEVREHSGDNRPMELMVYANKTEYNLGEELDVIVTLRDDLGLEREINTRIGRPIEYGEYLVEGYDCWCEGEQWVNFIWRWRDGEVRTEQLFTVRNPETADRYVEHLEVNLNRTEYYVGEELDLTVFVHYSDGTTEEVKEGDYEVSGYDRLYPGKQEVHITYMGCVYDIMVEVIKKPSSSGGSSGGGGSDTPDEEKSFISINDITTLGGLTERIPVYISNNKGFAGYKMKIYYDNTRLIPKSVSSSEDISCNIQTNLTDPSFDAGTAEYFTVVASTMDNITLESGILFYVDFEIVDAEDVVGATYIDPEITEMLDALGTNVAYNIQGGTVNIIRPLYGDVNTDNTIAMYDLILMEQYVSGWSGDYNNFFMTLADVYYDKVVNTKDIVLLSRYLAEWQDIVLGPKE